MTNKQKQAHIARRTLRNENKRPRHQFVQAILVSARSVKGGHKLHLPAFLNLWKCKKGACRKLNK